VDGDVLFALEDIYIIILIVRTFQRGRGRALRAGGLLRAAAAPAGGDRPAQPGSL
jgi:hypothetical protein